MSDAYSVDLAELDRCVSRLSAFETFIDGKIDELDQRVQQIQSVWSGAAADAQLAAHREWLAGAADMKAGLVQLRRAAATAHANYTAARTANLKMWG